MALLSSSGAIVWKDEVKSLHVVQEITLSWMARCRDLFLVVMQLISPMYVIFNGLNGLSLDVLVLKQHIPSQLNI